MTAPWLRRGLVTATVALAACAGLLGGTGRPAGADPARPTNYESRIMSVDPPTDGATVDIEGGDAFMVLSVQPGRRATVPDYGAGNGGRPYLRFQPDGTVERNEHSAAAAANESRFGTGPADFDPEREPRWRQVATNGTYAWHDHRIHLMAPDHLAVIDENGRVDLGGTNGTWEVLLLVDDVETVVRGELIRRDAPPAWPWYLTGTALGTGALVLLGSRRPSRRPELRLVPPILLLAVAGLATYVSVAELSRAPEGSGASAVPVLIATGALLGATAMLGGRLRGIGAGTVTRVGTALSAATLSWWAVARVDVWSHAILPSGLGALDRAVTATSLGLGAALAVLLVWKPGRLTASEPSPGQT